MLYRERSLARGLRLCEQVPARLGRVSALRDWLVETHVSKAIFQATEVCRQLCSMNVVCASFVVGLAVDAHHRERDSEFMRGGPAEQALSSRGNAGIALTHLGLSAMVSESAPDSKLCAPQACFDCREKWMARQPKELVFAW